jgi:hypothetical protein
MAVRKDIDAILKGWSYQPGEIAARLIRATNGRQVLQLRIDMGVMQLEMTGRPDGERPHGFETYLDYLLAESLHAGTDFRLSEEQCAEVDREFVQFYQRRICWLALREFQSAVTDADHSLALMSLARASSPNENWTLEHEQYRPFIQFHRTQAAALAAVDAEEPESAVEEINQGLESLRLLFEEFELAEKFEEDDLVGRLRELRESIREHYHLGRTLAERLADAIAREQFELAAHLRDELARRRDAH